MSQSYTRGHFCLFPIGGRQVHVSPVPNKKKIRNPYILGPMYMHMLISIYPSTFTKVKYKINPAKVMEGYPTNDNSHDPKQKKYIINITFAYI